MNAPTLGHELSHAELRNLRDSIVAAIENDAGADSRQLDRTALVERLLGPDLCRKLGIFQIPAGFKLSVVMPVYNEIVTLPSVIDRIRGTNLPIELVIVDDG